ncbi:MAG TPA: hypothetical protein VF627_12160 [Abditibacterium sp.]|jgi:hypothetical protein
MQTPSNPYENPGVPPGGGPPFGAPGMASPAPRGPIISFDTITEAWTLLKPNIGVWIGAVLVYAVISGVFSGLQNVLTPKDVNGVPQIGPIYLLISLVSFVVGQFFIGGFYRMGLNNVRTGRADLGQLFSATDVLLPLIGSALLSGIAIVIGFLFCLLPGMLLAALLLFMTPLIVDKRMGVFESMSTSFNTLKPQMWMALIYAIVIGLLAYSGLIACLVGVLVTAPLALLAICLTYRDFFDGNAQPAVMPMRPIAPIADPRA